MTRHTYGQDYTREQLAHAAAVRAARDAGRAFSWVPATAPAIVPEDFAPGYSPGILSVIMRARHLPGDLVWTAETGWVGGGQ